jgi:hypothetical protein
MEILIGDRGEVVEIDVVLDKMGAHPSLLPWRFGNDHHPEPT